MIDLINGIISCEEFTITPETTMSTLPSKSGKFNNISDLMLEDLKVEKVIVESGFGGLKVWLYFSEKDVSNKNEFTNTIRTILQEYSKESLGFHDGAIPFWNMPYGMLHFFDSNAEDNFSRGIRLTYGEFKTYFKKENDFPKLIFKLIQSNILDEICVIRTDTEYWGDDHQTDHTPIYTTSKQCGIRTCYCCENRYQKKSYCEPLSYETIIHNMKSAGTVYVNTFNEDYDLHINNSMFQIKVPQNKKSNTNNIKKAYAAFLQLLPQCNELLKIDKLTDNVQASNYEKVYRHQMNEKEIKHCDEIVNILKQEGIRWWRGNPIYLYKKMDDTDGYLASGGRYVMAIEKLNGYGFDYYIVTSDSFSHLNNYRKDGSFNFIDFQKDVIHKPDYNVSDKNDDIPVDALIHYLLKLQCNKAFPYVMHKGICVKYKKHENGKYSLTPLRFTNSGMINDEKLALCGYQEPFFEKITCPDCGNEWFFFEKFIPDGEKYETTCPHCGCKVTRKKINRDKF